MSDMLTQEEIDALLRGNNQSDAVLTPEEVDAIGEIGNISMGTSATTLFALLNNKVTITTPKVSVMTWDDLVREYPIPYVAVEVKFTEGFDRHDGRVAYCAKTQHGKSVMLVRVRPPNG